MATEEFVRWSTPVLQFARFATQDVRGSPASASASGDKVGLFYCSANRRRKRVRRPAEVRPEPFTNPQVGFEADGPHFCLGNQLAKTELRNIFRELLTRLTTIELGEPTCCTAASCMASSGFRARAMSARHLVTEPRRGRR